VIFGFQSALGDKRGSRRVHVGAMWLMATAFLVVTATESVAEVPANMPATQTVVARLSMVFNAVWAVLAPVAGSFSSIPKELMAAIRAILASSATSGKGELLAGAASLFAMMLLPGLWGVLMRKLTRGQSADAFGHIWQRFGLDCGLALAVAIFAVLMTELLSAHETLAGGLAVALVDLGFRFFGSMMVLAILLRPGEAAIRLLDCDDATVSAVTPRLGVPVVLVIGFTAIIPTLLQAGMNWPTGQAFAIVVGTLAVGLGYMAVGRLLAGLKNVSARWRIAQAVGAILFWLSWCYGVIRLDFPFFEATVAVGIILAVGFVFDRVMVKAAETSETIPEDKKRMLRLTISNGLRRTSHVVGFLALCIVVTRWGVANFQGTVREARWNENANVVGEAALTVIIGYCLFELISGWIQSTFDQPRVNTMPGDDEDIAPASRLLTVVPLLRGVAGFAILAVTALVAISKLGIDITPVLAGAGILGLAISFGSQSLVRDVVAGIFYMADDAFRVGEYIEAAKLKGTIEKISIRSMRLRHHNGHVHTIAYGQLGFVTNFSRDWVTMKFNLRLRA
jgi:moderate conductance mechanosensitive channel